MAERQMTIFEWLSESIKEDGYPDINDIDEAEAVRIVGENTGLSFSLDKYFKEWIAKKGDLKFDLHYRHFKMKDNNDLFLGAGWNFKQNEGASIPAESIDQVIKFFNKAIKTKSMEEK